MLLTNIKSLTLKYKNISIGDVQFIPGGMVSTLNYDGGMIQKTTIVPDSNYSIFNVPIIISDDGNVSLTTINNPQAIPANTVIKISSDGVEVMDKKIELPNL